MKTVNTDKAPAAIGPYSQAIISGGLVFTSGQIPVDPATGAVAGETIVEQAKQVMANLQVVLAFNEIYAQTFMSKPARSCVAVRTLPKGVLCEVEVVAEI